MPRPPRQSEAPSSPEAQHKQLSFAFALVLALIAVAALLVAGLGVPSAVAVLGLAGLALLLVLTVLAPPPHPWDDFTEFFRRQPRTQHTDPQQSASPLRQFVGDDLGLAVVVLKVGADGPSGSRPAPH